MTQAEILVGCVRVGMVVREDKASDAAGRCAREGWG